jgi:hypothetical protein
MKSNFLLTLLLLTICPLALGVFIYMLSPDFRIIRNYLPDTLWSFSFYSTLTIFGAFNSNKRIIFISSVCIFVFYEFGQKYNIFSGTYDYLDFVSYSVGLLLAFFIVEIFYIKN